MRGVAGCNSAVGNEGVYSLFRLLILIRIGWEWGWGAVWCVA